MHQAAVVPFNPHGVLLPYLMLIPCKGRVKTFPVVRGYMIQGDTKSHKPLPEFLCGFQVPLSPDIDRYFPGSPVTGINKPAFMGIFPCKCPNPIDFKGIVVVAFEDREIMLFLITEYIVATPTRRIARISRMPDL